MTSPRPKLPIPVGTDTACSVKTGAQGAGLPISYWDLWFAIVATEQYEGDLDRLAEHFRQSRAALFGKENAVRKLSHLRDLQQRLGEAGVAPAAVIEAAGPDLARQEERRAADRVLRHNERQYERSAPMLCPPEKRLYPAVLREHWPLFPVSPEPYAERLAERFDWGRCHGERASHGLARKLDAETARVEELLTKPVGASPSPPWGSTARSHSASP